MSRKRSWFRRLCHVVWVQWQESSAIAFGQPIVMDAADTGDRYVRSPLITEVRETHTVRASAHVKL